ncbi:MFS transporter [Kitasatospora sp. NBC_01287]|uniref:MFS transporter n=1 Tax=Kitasatospora sp. NBC_01287 TaxID=2903573 RepID=UPI002256B3E7|nr:MFS transporter [Kitasatospora sp. NBC_01287]MCX4751251.1 MFS transporter [Kitasatospora sp. NBC_01287]
MSTTPAVSGPAQDSSYRAVLGTRHVARLLGGTLIGRLPTGMAPIAILLLVRAEHGSLAFAGLLGALYGLAAAIGQPLLGRLVDRHGQTAVLYTAAPAASAAFLLLPCTGPVRHPVLAVLTVVVAGLATPPLEAGLRALWPVLLPDPERQRAALALDSSSQGLVFIAGPLLAAGISAATGPHGALVATAALGLLGTGMVITAEPSLAWTPNTSAQRMHWMGPLRVPGLRVLFAALAGIGVALGAVNVLALAAAERHHASWLAGVMPAALSIGSMIGGLAYGRHTWPGTPARHLVTASVGFAAGWLPLLPDPAPAVAVVLAALPGIFLAPLLTAGFLTVDRLAPKGESTEAFAWLIACIGVGQAVGTGLASLADSAGPLPAALVPLAGACTALWLLHRVNHRLSA